MAHFQYIQYIYNVTSLIGFSVFLFLFGLYQALSFLVLESLMPISSE